MVVLCLLGGACHQEKPLNMAPTTNQGQAATHAGEGRHEGLDKQLVGKWTGRMFVNGVKTWQEDWEFKGDGTFTTLITHVVGKKQDRTGGRWKAADEPTMIEFEFDEDDRPSRVYSCVIDGKHLVIVMDPKKSIESRLERVE
jgi:hypothetical protein